MHPLSAVGAAFAHDNVAKIARLAVNAFVVIAEEFENEGEITMRMGLEPRQLNGNLRINSLPRLAHNCAVNFLRRRKYHEADVLDASNASVTPALLSSTALDRFNAVLTPETRINGSVQLFGRTPVLGLGINPQGPSSDSAAQFTESEGEDNTQGGEPDPARTIKGWRVGTTFQDTYMYVEEDPRSVAIGGGIPNIRVELDRDLSLKDFMQAEMQDDMMRAFDDIIRRYPEHGEEMVARFVHGLQIETDKTPFKVFERTVFLNPSLKSGMDGPNLDVEITNTTAAVNFSAIVPKNEFGGLIVTFISVKPEEVMTGQPHPVLTKPWGVDNHAADKLIIDPVPVLRRDLDNDVDPVFEENVMFYVGNNHLQRRYMRTGWSRDVNVETVDHKSAMWRYEVPISVTPGNIIYPEDIDHYPFSLNAPDDPVASYTFKSALDLRSPTILGPTPIEDIAIVDDQQLFGQPAPDPEV